MTEFLLTLACLCFLYILVLTWIFTGLDRLQISFSHEEPFVSIVVAARNEADNMHQLLHALTHQSYPSEKYEIIIVDDQSEDATTQIVYAFADERIRLVQTNNRHQVISHKKNAINLGIYKAKGEIILLTDADCLPPVEWVSGMVQLFTPNVGMVIGFSPYELPELRTPFDFLLALESLSLAAVTAGTTGWDYPATASGRNLAYRKSLYQQVGGFDKIRDFISGDDDLMLKLVQSTPWKIRYAYDPKLTVPTRLVKSVRQFINQRLRHASKGFHYDLKKVIVLLLVYFYNLLIFFTIPFALFHRLSAWVPVLFIGIKALGEFFVLYKFASSMRRQRFLFVFPFAELLHIPYVVIFGALGPFKKVKWKG
ncbi:glycosyltransferase [candidate division KSB1 bacterium]|nr:glycosyltransferase [candidate division KSB1 bacterium]